MLSASHGEISEDKSKHTEEPETKIWLSNVVFVSAIHTVAIAAMLAYRPHRYTLWMCLILWQASSLGVTMGYHRLWSHKTFEATLSLRILLAGLGTIAFQGSIKWWVFRHRLHHRFVDSADDPHDAGKGLWYSHIGWIFERKIYPKGSLIDITDIMSDAVVRFQHTYFIPLAVSLAFGFPTLLAWFGWGDFWGGLLYGGFVLRILIWHSVFSINSLAHKFGSQEYSKDISARGNWFLALITCGEGHHNFHHEFPNDFRNGIMWYDYDPTKWAILLASRLNYAKKLKSTSFELMSMAKRNALESIDEKPVLRCPKMTKRDFSQRCEKGEPLIMIEGWVISIRPYLDQHPGGREILQEFIGRDATRAFSGGLNHHSQAARLIAMKHRIAKIIDN